MQAPSAGRLALQVEEPRDSAGRDGAVTAAIGRELRGKHGLGGSRRRGRTSNAEGAHLGYAAEVTAAAPDGGSPKAPTRRAVARQQSIEVSL